MPRQPHRAQGARGPCLVTQSRFPEPSSSGWDRARPFWGVRILRVHWWPAVSTHDGDDAHLSGSGTGASSLGRGPSAFQESGCPKPLCSHASPALCCFPTSSGGGRPRESSSVLMEAWSQRPGGPVPGLSLGMVPLNPLLWSPLLNEQGELVFPEPGLTRPPPSLRGRPPSQLCAAACAGRAD